MENWTRQRGATHRYFILYSNLHGRKHQRHSIRKCASSSPKIVSISDSFAMTLSHNASPFTECSEMGISQAMTQSRLCSTRMGIVVQVTSFRSMLRERAVMD